MRKFIINQDDAVAIGNYLLGKPYAEVWQFVAVLQSLQEMPAPAPVADASEAPVKENSPNHVSS